MTIPGAKGRGNLKLGKWLIKGGKGGKSDKKTGATPGGAWGRMGEKQFDQRIIIMF